MPDPPSPNVQLQSVILPVDRSVKLTVNGSVPDVGEPENSATGGGGGRQLHAGTENMNKAESVNKIMELHNGLRLFFMKTYKMYIYINIMRTLK